MTTIGFTGTTIGRLRSIGRLKAPDSLQIR
jgi:hypothetical protein